MKKSLPIFPFLFALYPIITLYARNPGEIPFQTVVWPVISAFIFTGILLGLFTILFRDLYKAAIITSLLVFYLSSSGHVFRILKGYLFPDITQNLHPALILLELLLVILVANNKVWDKYITKISHVSVTRFANLFSLLILIYPALTLANFSLLIVDDPISTWTKSVAGNDDQNALAGTRKPDIYLIILDGYARNDVLRDIYAFENTNFTDDLAQRGFFIAERSHSNYLQTPLSFTSFLNYSHIDTATQLLGDKSINRLPLINLIEFSKVITSLKEIGYQLVTTESGFHFTDLEIGRCLSIPVFYQTLRF